MSPSSCCWVLLDLRQGLLVLLAGRRQVALAAFELAPRSGELGALGGDLVARRPHPLDGVLGLVAKVADALGDRGVLGLDPLQVLVAAEQLVEPVRVQDHRERVGTGSTRRSRPAAPSAPSSERLRRTRRTTSRSLARFSSASFLLQLGLDDRLAVAKRRHLPAELVELLAEALDRASTARPRARWRARAAPACASSWDWRSWAGAPAAIASTATIAAHSGERRSPPRGVRVQARLWRLSCLPRSPTGLADGLARRSRAWPLDRTWPVGLSPLGIWFPRSARSRYGRIRHKCGAAGYQAREFCEQSLTVVMPAASGFSRSHGAPITGLARSRMVCTSSRASSSASSSIWSVVCSIP